MIRLVFSDLVAQARIWCGILLVTLTAGFVSAFATALLQTSTAYGGQVHELLNFASGIMLSFTAVTVVIVLITTSNLTVALQQRSYALWQLVGILPSRVRIIVLSQLTVVSILGTTIGCLIAIPFLQPVFEYLLAERAELAQLHVRYSLHPFFGVVMVGVMVLIVILGGLGGARRASLVPPIEALRTPEPTAKTMGKFRWVLAALLLVWFIANTNGLSTGDPAKLQAYAPVAAPLAVGILVALGPLLYPWVLRAWTSLVPAKASPAWYLARHSAAFRLSQSNAAVGPLMVAVTLAGGLIATGMSLEAFANSNGATMSGNNSVRDLLLLLGGPLLMSAVAAASSVFMSGRAREREFALIQASGSTHATIVRTAVLEAVVYAVTAALLGVIAVVISQFSFMYAFDVPFQFAILPIVTVTAAGLVLLIAATVLPTASALRRDIPRTLADT